MVSLRLSELAVEPCSTATLSFTALGASLRLVTVTDTVSGQLYFRETRDILSL